MADTWYAIYDVSTGALVSVGTVIADSTDLKDQGLAKVQLAGEPDLSAVAWDATTHAFVDIAQPVDRVNDFVAALGANWAVIDPVQQEAITAELGDLLGSQRYRAESDPVNL